MARIVLNRKEVRNLLRSEAMKDEVSKHAERIKNRCGVGYETDAMVGKTRVNASVRTKTEKAVKDNSDNNTLLKAVR